MVLILIQGGRTWSMIMGDWGFNVSNINSDVLALTATDDVIHHPAMTHRLKQMNPGANLSPYCMKCTYLWPEHVRIHLEKNGGRLYPLLKLKSCLQRMLQRQVDEVDIDLDNQPQRRKKKSRQIKKHDPETEI